LDELRRALDELGDLIIEVDSDERKLSAVAARLTELDLQELGISMPDSGLPCTSAVTDRHRAPHFS
jgi:hypothetical protein